MGGGFASPSTAGSTNPPAGLCKWVASRVLHRLRSCEGDERFPIVRDRNGEIRLDAEGRAVGLVTKNVAFEPFLTAFRSSLLKTIDEADVALGLLREDERQYWLDPRDRGMWGAWISWGFVDDVRLTDRMIVLFQSCLDEEGVPLPDRQMGYFHRLSGRPMSKEGTVMLEEFYRGCSQDSDEFREEGLRFFFHDDDGDRTPLEKVADRMSRGGNFRRKRWLYVPNALLENDRDEARAFLEFYMDDGDELVRKYAEETLAKVNDDDEWAEYRAFVEGYKQEPWDHAGFSAWAAQELLEQFEQLGEDEMRECAQTLHRTQPAALDELARWCDLENEDAADPDSPRDLGFALRDGLEWHGIVQALAERLDVTPANKEQVLQALLQQATTSAGASR